MNSLLISEWKNPSFDLYGTIPISFEVDKIYEVADSTTKDSGIKLRQKSLLKPYIKDYDFHGNKASDWNKTWDLSNWVFFAAHVDASLIGCCALAWKTPELEMLENRDDLAVLWDIRIKPDFRRRGFGLALFNSCKDWAKKREIKFLKIETQNINVPACEFYAAQGCLLAEANRNAYPKFPEEIQLIWILRL